MRQFRGFKEQTNEPCRTESGELVGKRNEAPKPCSLLESGVERVNRARQEWLGLLGELLGVVGSC